MQMQIPPCAPNCISFLNSKHRYNGYSNLRMSKTTFVLLFSALVMALFTSSVDAGVPVPMKVMSFNVRTTLANDPCPSGCWARRKERIKQLLAKYTPDFIGTQEGAPDQIQFFQDTLGYASVGECAGACELNERDSIFYVKDRWTLLKNSTFALVRLDTWQCEAIVHCIYVY